MRRELERYVIEVTLVALGALAALAEAVFVHKTDTALLVGFVSFLFALGVVAVRQEVSRQVGDLLAERRVIEQIPSDRWRADAQAEVDEARDRYTSWATGTRFIPVSTALNYQIGSLRRASDQVRAIHLGLERDGLVRWADPQKGFSKLVDAYRSLPPSVTTRRILVLDASNASETSVIDGQRTITADLIEEVCRMQITPRSAGGLGVDLRILWIQPGDRTVSDLLIVDDHETCSIQSLGRDRFGELMACISPPFVAAEIRRFEDLWTNAIDVHLCLRCL